MPLEQIFTVSGIRIQTQAAQPPLDAQLQHGFLVRAQYYARLVVDKAAQPAKVSFRDGFIARTHCILDIRRSGLALSSWPRLRPLRLLIWSPPEPAPPLTGRRRKPGQCRGSSRTGRRVYPC